MSLGPIKIGDFQVLETLTGGTSPFYKATAPDGRVIALKTLPIDGSSPEQRERFLREAEIAKTLNHPNLLAVMESGTTGTHLYQVMEFLEGSDLRKLLAKQHSFTMDEKLSLMEQACDGLAYAHQRALVHRDLKPANLFVENSGRLKILDFGVARVADSNLTKAGMAVGTLNYMSPEQLRGEKCTAASDVFSCGVVFYELITGRHPFSSGVRDVSAIMSNVMFEAPPPMRDSFPEVTSSLELMIGQALEKDAARRVQNASELRGLLRYSRSSGQIAAAPAPTTARPPDLKATRKYVRPNLSELQAPPAKSAPAVAVPAPPAPRPVTAKPRDLVYCPACTHPNRKEAKVCTSCGAPLSVASPDVTAMHTARGSRRLLVIAGIAVAAMLTAAILIRGLFQ
ncbi:MAG: protein kinase [Candidatus Solibacter usitatus]|nr:protein kinase [Candidatus Solibacter usitatus]